MPRSDIDWEIVTRAANGLAGRIKGVERDEILSEVTIHLLQFVDAGKDVPGALHFAKLKTLEHYMRGEDKLKDGGPGVVASIVGDIDDIKDRITELASMCAGDRAAEESTSVALRMLSDVRSLIAFVVPAKQVPMTRTIERQAATSADYSGVVIQPLEGQLTLPICEGAD